MILVSLIDKFGVVLPFPSNYMYYFFCWKHNSISLTAKITKLNLCLIKARIGQWVKWKLMRMINKPNEGHENSTMTTSQFLDRNNSIQQTMSVLSVGAKNIQQRITTHNVMITHSLPSFLTSRLIDFVTRSRLRASGRCDISNILEWDASSHRVTVPHLAGRWSRY